MIGSDGVDGYETACRRWAEGRLAVWRELRILLEGRSGWDFEPGENGDEPCWSFTPAGRWAPRLNVTVQYENLCIYDVGRDEEKPVLATGFAATSFGSWLRLHEGDYSEG